MDKIFVVLKRDFQKHWLELFSDTMEEELEAMGDVGTFDVFVWTKKLVHRVITA